MLCPYGFIGAIDMEGRAEGTSGRRAVNSKAIGDADGLLTQGKVRRAGRSFLTAS
jgi:hypothetical protein